MATPAQVCGHWYNIGCHLGNVMDWWLDLELWLPRKIGALVLDALASLIEAMPAPAAIETFTSNIGTAMSGAGYLAGIFAVKEGLALIAAAYVARFVLRRIPLIGG
jgi:hypothetical protein